MPKRLSKDPIERMFQLGAQQFGSSATY